LEFNPVNNSISADHFGNPAQILEHFG